MPPAPSGEQRPILVAGGGIGGLCAALALSRIGQRALVLEQVPEFKEVGAGIQLGPNVFKMLDRLGLREAIEKVAVFPDSLNVHDAVDGERVMHIPLGPAFRERYRNPYAVVYRPDLLKAIYRACLAAPLVTLVAGEKVVDIYDHGSVVIVKTAAGETFEGSGLVGADGLWSRVRQHIVGDGQPRRAGHVAYRAVIPIEKAPQHARAHRVTLWAGPRIHLVHYPLRRGELLNLVAVFHSDRYEEGWDVFGDPSELKEKFQAAGPEVQELLGLIETWRMWVLCDRDPVEVWTKGLATLLGDAAHPMLQYMAQGAAMAIEDSVVLADKLKARGGDFARAALEYQEERYLRTARVQLTSRFVGDYVYHPRGPAAEVRNDMLRKLSPESMAWLYDGI
ncbi:MAG: 3-hydroxybenzoate 6-monooxygenase [Myxococcales bacterium]